MSSSCVPGLPRPRLPPPVGDMASVVEREQEKAHRGGLGQGNEIDFLN